MFEKNKKGKGRTIYSSLEGGGQKGVVKEGKVNGNPAVIGAARRRGSRTKKSHILWSLPEKGFALVYQLYSTSKKPKKKTKYLEPLLKLNGLLLLSET